jgi:hypothetical protein
MNQIWIRFHDKTVPTRSIFCTDWQIESGDNA